MLATWPNETGRQLPDALYQGVGNSDPSCPGSIPRLTSSFEGVHCDRSGAIAQAQSASLGHQFEALEFNMTRPQRNEYRHCRT